MKADVEAIFSKVDFINRYKKISESNQRDCGMPYQVKKKELIELFQKCGFNDIKYFSEDKYYQVEYINISNDLSVSLNFYLRWEEVDFVLDIHSAKEVIKINGPFGYVAQKLGERNFIRRPCFCSKDELYSIIADCISLYKDLKSNLLKLDRS